MQMRYADLDSRIKNAIRVRRIIEFVLDQVPRVAEPHDYGLIDGEARLFFYQIGGKSRSGRPLGWRWAVLSKISELRALDRNFHGSRPVPSGRHVKWDKLFATVRVYEVKKEVNTDSA